MGRVRTIKPKPVDHFGNIIELGDAYFYGAPPTAGRVSKITGSSIEITYYARVWNHTTAKFEQGEDTMLCRSPEKGVCLDKTYDKKIT